MSSWVDKTDFKNAVMEWAIRLEIQVAAIYLRPMKNKWASCSTNGQLNFNTELLEIDKGVGEYVIVHELMHFRIPNHGPLWKSLMNAYLPGWEALEQKLQVIVRKNVGK